jgi:hypothetical protein
MATDAGLRVDGCCLVVDTSLADVAVGDGRDFGAVPVAVRGPRTGAATQLAGGFAVGDGEHACEEGIEEGMLHDHVRGSLVQDQWNVKV